MGRDTTDDHRRTTGLAWAKWYDGLQSARPDGPRSGALVRAKQYVDDRFIEGVPLDAMASQARLSKYHFVRVFRELFHRTPHQYQVERRIGRARELLERTDLTVTAVCFEVGFESLGSFIARFRERTGQSPGRYRRRFSRRGPVDGRAIPACLHDAGRPKTAIDARPVTTDRNFGEAPNGDPL